MKSIKIFLFFTFSVLPLFLFSQISSTETFSVNNLSLTALSASDNNNYTLVELEDANHLNEAGTPDLPIRYVSFIIPNGQMVDYITITNSVSQSFTLTNFVYPVQQPTYTCSGCPPPVFATPSMPIYSSANPWPSDMVNLISQGYFDGSNNVITIAICPFQYYPNDSRLDFFTSISVNITLKSSTNTGITRKRLSKDQQLYNDILAKLVKNTQDISSFMVSPILETEIEGTASLPCYEYVIITPNAFSSSFNPFIEWKKKKGINIGIVTIEDILSNYTGDMLFPGDEILDDAGKLRQYLSEAYQNGTVYALLAGDATYVPIRFGWSSPSSIPTDLYFADFNGNWNVDHDNLYGEFGNDSPDYIPEIFVGRLLCSSAQDVTNWVQKLLVYEKNPGNGDLSYLTESFMFQADHLQQGDQATKVSQHLTMFNHTIWGELPSAISPDPTFPKGADIIAEVNTNHYGLMSWFGHGGSGGQNSGVTTLSSGLNSQPYWKLDAEDAYEFWDVQPETGDGLDNLTNTNFPFIIYAISCDINPFDITKSQGNSGARNCGESFTVNNLGGGIAFLGNTRFGWVSSSYLLFEKFCDLVSQSSTLPSFSHLGVAELTAQAQFHHTYLSYSHNLIGDPENTIWTATPQTLTVEINPNTSIVNTNNYVEIAISNLGYNKLATVCLYKENEVFATLQVTGDQNNKAVAFFENILPLTTGNIAVTVTSHNYLPYEGLIPVEENCTITISSNTLWNTKKIISCKVVVEEGAQLTITSQILLYPSVKIVVERGAKLIINEGTLDCISKNELWLGIEIHGNTDEIQANVYQGLLEINGGTIENANCAVKTYKPDPSMEADPLDPEYSGMEGWTGGIVVATNATFRNNRNAVVFALYQNGSMSFFDRCTFETTGDLNDGSLPNYFVTMNSITGVNFYGCTFQNSNKDAGLLPENRGSGIYSYNSTLFLNENSTTMTMGTFRNLYYGVRDLAAGVNWSSVVDKQNFFDNFRGIYLSGRSYTEFTQNYLRPYDEPDNPDPQSYGAYFDQCTGYHIEANTFDSENTSRTGIGLIINKSGSVANEVYRNVFSNLRYATLAQSFNRGTNNVGLCYKCNDFSNNMYDIKITPQASPVVSPQDGIAAYQGYYAVGNNLAPAGNLFSDLPNNGSVSFHNTANSITYFKHQNPTQLYRLYPENCQGTGSISVTPVPLTTRNSSACPSKLDLGDSSPDYLEKVVEADEAADALSSDLAALNDGGNTEALTLKVETSIPDQSLELRDELLAVSPYLTDTVLDASIEQEEALPGALLRDVMVANPQSAKNDILLQKLEDRQNPLSNEMWNEIMAGTSVTGAKENKEAEYGYWKNEAYYRWSRINRRMLINQVIADSMIDVWSNSNLAEARSNLALYYLATGNVNQGISVLDSALIHIPEGTKEWNEMISLRGYIQTIANAYPATDSTMIASLETLMSESDGLAEALSRNALIQCGAISFNEPILIDEGLKSERSHAFGLKPVNENNTELLSVYPNPAKGYFVAKAILAGQSGVLTLISSTGVTVMEKQIDHSSSVTIPVSHLPAGVYAIRLTENGALKAVIKVTLQ